MKLTERVYLVGSGAKGFHLTDTLDCHVYLIDGRGELALIDSGAGYGTGEIINNIKKEGFDINQLKHLLLTHAHADHAGGAKNIVNKIGTQVYASDLTAQYLENGDEDAISLTSGKESGLYPKSYKYQATKVDRVVKEGDYILVGDLKLTVINTPGHSNDHISFLMESGEVKYLFAGDLVFYEGKIATQNIYDCNVYEIGKSIQKLKQENIDVLLAGHDSIVLKKGQDHINMGINYYENSIIPPSIIY